MVELQFNRKIKTLQADMGGEFKPFIPYLTDLGVQIRFSCPHSHQQNGIAERKHRHLVEVGLTLLAHAHMPLKFWVEAFHTAAVLINNLPTPVLNFQVPFQILFQKRSNYHFFKSFGCACYPYLRPFSKQKFGFHTSKCVFIGYSIHHKGYKCLHSTGRVYVSRNVIFNELEFPFKSLFEVNIQPTAITSMPISMSQTDVPRSVLPHSNVSPLMSTDHHNSSNQHASNSSQFRAPTTSPDWYISLPTGVPTDASQSPDISKLSTQPITSVHPMITRSKAGIFKPKAYSALCQSPFGPLVAAEPKNVKAALTDAKCQ
ncbi:hypothetical protein EZV62_027308 [Acer yangbiense]|uniref:Integrase catalytic domain-containing protein n=1 Tax=Acer yangbiense TaxID=1000413 RepID=A0A5C7GTB8_9ROSI|nr:hypothetical protein EZV62_027308 [Acer yangbiense]